MKQLVQQGAKINFKNKKDSALKLSAENGQLEVVKYLINHGANIHASNNNDTLINAASHGYLEIVKYLVEKGANINAINMSRNSVLKMSAIFGHVEVVKYLVENGADIYANNNDAFKYSVLNRKWEVVKYFLIDCNIIIQKDTLEYLIDMNCLDAINLIKTRDSHNNLNINNFNTKIKLKV